MSDWKGEAIRLWTDGMSWDKLVEHFRGRFTGLTTEQARNKIRDTVRRSPEYKARQDKPIEDKRVEEWNATKGEYTSDRLIEICDGVEITPELILAAHGLKPGLWEVISYRNNYWHSQVKGGKRLVMYQSRLTAKPIARGLDTDALAAHFAAMDRQYQQPILPAPRRPGHHMAEVNISDVHLGKLCGNTYNLEIGRDTFRALVSEIADNLRHIRLEYIMFIWTNDYFHYDTPSKTTTAGTPQDTDTAWPELFNTGVDLLVEATDILAGIAPVKMLYTSSNHDQVTAYHAIKYLEAWYRNDPRIEIDATATPRKYRLYGSTLLGFGHGHKEGDKGSADKASRLASLMPIEAAQLWGQAKSREFHAGHLHSEQMIQEINGVSVRRISAPTASDTYHIEHGYLGAVRKAQTFVYDRERGLMQIINTPVA